MTDDDPRRRGSSGAPRLDGPHAEADRHDAERDLFAPLEDDDDAREAGTLVDGRYELVERLGAGGMGSVWRAHDFLLDVDVALKLVRGDKLQIVGRERLIREARAAAAIHHPAVVVVHGFGSCGDDGYIAMELLEGRTLEQILDDEGPLAAVEAVRLALPVIDALASAHAAGVVHRDVKPGNIMVVDAPDGNLQPKLLDFGIAHQRRQAAKGRLTVTGQVLGTPCYMSYEQAAGHKNVDHRADVWSICCVIYELVAGVGPFDGDNYNAVLRAVLMDPPARLDEVTDDVDAELWAIIERGLEKEREHRWASMRELGLALRRWLVKRGHRTDIAGRAVVTGDFLEGFAPPDRDEGLPRHLTPRVPTLAMSPSVPPMEDDPGPTPPAITLTVPPPANPGQRVGLLGGAVALLALPLAALGNQPTLASLDAGIAALAAEATSGLSTAESPPEETTLERIIAAARATSETAERHDRVVAEPTGDDDEATPPDEARDTEAADEARDTEAGRYPPAPPILGTPSGRKVAGEPPAPTPAPRTQPRAPAQRHLAGSSLPLPTEPRFR